MIALAALRLGAARDWAEAMLTPVTVVALLAEVAAEAHERASSGRCGMRGMDEVGGVRRPDGTRVVRVRSLSELAAFASR